jgi:protein-L-isoaspartate(D-aspartate) O-methyltransferase
MNVHARDRARMVELNLEGRGIQNPRVLDAFRSVPREEFVPPELAEFVYVDAPLPIGEGQTISQPYVVAMTAEALGLSGGERVLEVGTGSGYAAAVFSRIAREVFTMDRRAGLVRAARERLERLRYRNVHVREGDGTLGWAEHAPFDAITVAACAPDAPPALLAELAVGGRLVMPTGPDEASQTLVRITRTGEHDYREERLADVRFVPLVGQQGWAVCDSLLCTPPGRLSCSDCTLAALVREAADPIADVDAAPVEAFLERMADARIVLLGGATHGTREFYRMRARITKELILRHGFRFVAIEADGPDAHAIADAVTDDARPAAASRPPERFPSWVWHNQDVSGFAAWLAALNAARPGAHVGFHGLDVYAMFTSIAAILEHLERNDPAAARVARHRYGALTPWQRAPTAYERAVLPARYRDAEDAVVRMLCDLLARRLDPASRPREQREQRGQRERGEVAAEARIIDAATRTADAAAAARYYRALYYGTARAWNLRDAHMFETLRALLSFYGPGAKGVVWAHNPHVGDATATEMAACGERSLGQLCRAELGRAAFAVGFGTDHGTVAAASAWGGPMQCLRLRPARSGSYESIFHEAGVPAFVLHLAEPVRRALRDELTAPRLERAIGVVYLPETELASHYFHASLPRQFDAYVWFDASEAVRPLGEAPTPAFSAHGARPAA